MPIPGHSPFRMSAKSSASLGESSRWSTCMATASVSKLKREGEGVRRPHPPLQYGCMLSAKYATPNASPAGSGCGPGRRGLVQKPPKHSKLADRRNEILEVHG